MIYRLPALPALTWYFDSSSCMFISGKLCVIFSFCHYWLPPFKPSNEEIQSVANADFIAHSRKDIPYLLAEIDRINTIIHGEGFSDIESMIDKYKAVLYDSNEPEGGE
jgi:hypothetical protein